MADYVWARDGVIRGSLRVAGTDADEVEVLPSRAIEQLLRKGMISLKAPAGVGGAEVTALDTRLDVLDDGGPTVVTEWVRAATSLAQGVAGANSRALPAHAAGDLLLVVIDTDGTYVTPTNPGWTLLHNNAYGENVYWKFGDGVESTLNWTSGSGPYNCAFSCSVYSKANAPEVVTHVAFSNTSGAANPTGEALIVYVATIHDSSAAIGSAAGTTTRVNLHVPSSSGLVLADEPAAVGALTSRTFANAQHVLTLKLTARASLATRVLDLEARNSQSLPIGKAGALTVASLPARFYNDSGVTRVIKSVRASVGVAPTGSSLIVDVNLGGTTIFGTQASRPTIAAAGFTNKSTGHTVTAWPDGTYLTVDIDQVGSTVAGSDLVVQVEVE